MLYAITFLGFIKNKMLHLKYVNLEIQLPRIKNAIIICQNKAYKY